MEGMEEKLGSILNNPQMMQQIMSMASSLNGQQPSQNMIPTPEPSVPDFDPAMLQKIMGLAGQMGIDPNQKALLAALHPYLTDSRVRKLEKAMRAAKLANIASTALNSGILSSLTGR